MLSGFPHDARLAWRGLIRAKPFTTSAVALLAVGIAGTTTMVVLAEGVLLRPLPVPEQSRVILAWKDLRASGYAHYPFGDRAISQVRDSTRLLQMVGGVDSNGVSQRLAVEGTVAAYVKEAVVVGAFFDVLGVPPLLGRRLAPSDDLDGAERVIVISARLWHRRYGGSPDVIGRRLFLDDHDPFTIVGVMPPDVDYPHGVEVWRPTRSVPLTETFGAAARQEIDLIARLRQGVTLTQAADELSTLTRRFEAEQSADAPRGLTPVVRRLDSVIVGRSATTIVALLVAVCLVLLIASANVANLLLMRAEDRRAELAVHMALGADVKRITRQLLLEALQLAALGTVIGIAISKVSLPWLIDLVPDGLPRIEAVRIDVEVVTIVVALVVTLVSLTAVGPAGLSARIARSTELRGNRWGGASEARRVRRILLLAQVALAVTVVASAGLIVRTVLHLRAIDLGMSVDRLAVVFLEMPKGKYTDQSRHATFLSSLIESLEAAPGVAAATPVNVEPFSGGWGVPEFFAEGQSDEQAATNPALGLEAVHESYFKTLGIRILRGRAFTSADRKGTLDVAIVSEDVARRTWPGENPLGKRLKWGPRTASDPWLTVVGVAARTRYQDLVVAKPMIYVPAVQFIVSAERLIVRSSTPIEQTARIVREVVGRIDPDVRVMRVSAFGAMFDKPLARLRFDALLLGIFAIVALVLTAVGHYAVTAAHVRQREREIAIRMALGATAWRIRRLVILDMLGLASVGAAIGLAGAVAGTRLVQGTLPGVEGLDAVSLAGAAVLLIVVSALPTWLSLHRATRGDAPLLLRF